MKEKEIVASTARLAMLELSDREAEQMGAEFGQILGYFDQLKEVDTEGVPPTFHPSATRPTRLRADKPDASLTPEEALENAPDTDGRHFKVPRVIE